MDKLKILLLLFCIFMVTLLLGMGLNAREINSKKSIVYEKSDAVSGSGVVSVEIPDKIKDIDLGKNEGTDYKYTLQLTKEEKDIILMFVIVLVIFVFVVL